MVQHYSHIHLLAVNLSSKDIKVEDIGKSNYSPKIGENITQGAKFK